MAALEPISQRPTPSKKRGRTSGAFGHCLPCFRRQISTVPAASPVNHTEQSTLMGTIEQDDIMVYCCNSLGGQALMNKCCRPQNRCCRHDPLSAKDFSVLTSGPRHQTLDELLKWKAASRSLFSLFASYSSMQCMRTGNQLELHPRDACQSSHPPMSPRFRATAESSTELLPLLVSILCMRLLQSSIIP